MSGGKGNRNADANVGDLGGRTDPSSLFVSDLAALDDDADGENFRERGTFNTDYTM